MKIQLSHSRHGSGLIIALFLCAVIGINIASYLVLVNSENTSTMRSLTWNSAIVEAEAGVEEALSHLNNNGGTNLSGLLSCGWSFLNGQYTMTRAVGDGFYTVSISSNANAPVIQSAGYFLLPDAVTGRSAGGGNVSGAPSGFTGKQMLGRTVSITTTNAALFAKGLVAKGAIDLRGNNMFSDSFDSADPAYSTNGLYTASRAKDNGDIATNSGLTNSLNVGNADIYGKVATGPGGSISIGPNGVVGTKAFIAAGNHGIQSGRSSDDMNVAFPDVTAPFSTAPPPGNLAGYTYFLQNGNQMLNNLSLSGNQKILVSGNAVLYVPGDVRLTGQAVITIPPGCSLKLYVGGTTDIGGQGIVNAAGNATNFYYYGLNSNTSLSLAGNGTFTGVVYAPNANFTVVGNGDLVGAVVCKTAQLTGNGSFHYDENLAKVGPKRGFTPINWREL